MSDIMIIQHIYTVELKWLEHLWNYEKIFETGVVGANECKSYSQVRRHNRDTFSILFNTKVSFVSIRISSSRGF